MVEKFVMDAMRYCESTPRLLWIRLLCLSLFHSTIPFLFQTITSNVRSVCVKANTFLLSRVLLQMGAARRKNQGAKDCRCTTIDLMAKHKLLELVPGYNMSRTVILLCVQHRT
jgi:hypothetical protein